MDDRAPRHLELLSVAPDHVVVTFRTPPGEIVRIQVTPVGDGTPAAALSSGMRAETDPDHAYHWTRVDGLDPDTPYRVSVEGAPRAWAARRDRVRTLPRPAGRAVARIAMTNDVHYGEDEAGRLEEVRSRPWLAGLPGARSLAVGHSMPEGMPNHARLMNEAAVRDIAEYDPDLVVVKGDLTHSGRPEQFAEFQSVYAPFADRLLAFRGNHDAKLSDDGLAGRYFATSIQGVNVAVLDTVLPGHVGGAIDADQIDWLREYARSATQPVLVVGHHNLYMPRSGLGPGRTLFRGVNPEDSAALLEVFAAHDTIAGYFSGHTHRNLRNLGPRGIPIVETASTKEFPGSWAAYDLYDGGFVQTLYQIRSPEALAWSVRTKQMFFGLTPLMNRGRAADRNFVHHYDAAPNVSSALPARSLER